MSNNERAAVIDRVISIEIARVTERSAIACARLRGRGDEQAADKAAVDAMSAELARLDISGMIVIGEGEKDEAPKLYVGETVGTGSGPVVDIAVDPLEGSTICAKALPNALCVMAISEKGGVLNVPDIYMDKIAIGPGYPPGVVDLDASPADNLNALAQAKGVAVSDLTACILDRQRHANLIAQVRDAGVGIRLIPAGDISGVIWAAEPAKSGIDIYMGSGGAPEGVFAAAALRCIGGQMQGRLKPFNREEAARAAKIGIVDIDKKYELSEMASGDAIFSATGITNGSILAGVRFKGGVAKTETLVLRAATGTVRRIKTTTRLDRG